MSEQNEWRLGNPPYTPYGHLTDAGYRHVREVEAQADAARELLAQVREALVQIRNGYRGIDFRTYTREEMQTLAHNALALIDQTGTEG